MGTSIGIDEIDDIECMSELMRCRGLSLGGLQTLDQMKQGEKGSQNIRQGGNETSKALCLTFIISLFQT